MFDVVVEERDERARRVRQVGYARRGKGKPTVTRQPSKRKKRRVEETRSKRTENGDEEAVDGVVEGTILRAGK